MRLRATRRSAVAAPRAASPWAFYNDFTTGVLDSRFAFSRSSPAWKFNSAGILVQAAANAPRFAFDPVTKANLGLQFESEARTNTCLWSNDLSNAAWTKTFLSVGTAATSPLGPAQLVVPSAANNLHNLAQSVTNSSGATTCSFVAKALGYGKVCFREGTATGAVFGWDLSAGIVLPGLTAGAAIEALGDGWFRCAATWAASAGARTHLFYVVDNAFAGNSPHTYNWVADGTSGIYITGFQVELGASASSPLPTLGAAATRAADVCTMTGANFSNWYAGAAECTLFSHSMLTREPGALTYPSPFRLLSTDLLSRISLYFTGTAVNAVGEVVTAGTFQGGSSTPAPINSFYKVAERAATNNLRAASNGVLGVLDATVVYPNNLVRAELGSSGFMGFIKSVGVATRGMTDAELPAITAA